MANPNWVPGHSGNPKGRPKKGRTYADLIDKAMSKTMRVGGKRIARKRVMAKLLAEIATEGKAVFEDGTSVKFTEADEWTTYVMRLLKHLEGDPPAQHDVLVDGEIRLICDMPQIQPGM